MNSKRLVSLILAIIMLIGCITPLTACKDKKKNSGSGSTDGGGETAKCPGCAVEGVEHEKCEHCSNYLCVGDHTECGGTSSTPGKTNYVIKVQSTAGMPLEGIAVYIHKGDADFNMVAKPQYTDANGTVTFELTTANDYSIELDGVPNGYSAKSGETRADRYDMGVGGQTIKLQSAVIKGENLADSYKLGDVIHDFTVTDSNGNVITLSELLETKKMVMLNYWYEGCGNCANEFPVINKVYSAYKDEIEILALNDYASDTKATVEGYREYIGVDLEMPLCKIGNTDNDMTLSKYDSVGYPTTVIIDRYGVICLVEVGAVLGESKWKNLFDHFTAEYYEQQLYTSIDELSPRIEPTIEWQGSESIANAFNYGEISVEYGPETNEKDAQYSWPFAATTYNGTDCVAPTNSYVENSYATLYAYVKLKPEQAIVLDYISSCEYSNDRMYVVVNGKDIVSLTGLDDENVWNECCIFVDPRVKTEENQDDEITYTIGFVYWKNDEISEGDDTVYLKDLRIISTDEISVPTYIYRYAATDADEWGENYSYVPVVLADDGYYHVGKADGPLLLANLLGYTVFDSDMSVSQRLYAVGELMVDGRDRFKEWEMYGNFASNSDIYGYTPVTEDLRKYLEAYVEIFRTADGIAKDAGENLWLELCSYYSAYGKDENGVAVPEMSNPIIGLATFSAFTAVMDDPATEEIETNTVTYNKVIIPRGLLYEFTAPKAGAYRVTSSSTSEVNGWILSGTSESWLYTENGERLVIADFEEEERICSELIITDSDGNPVRDMLNVSLVTYLEEGETCYIVIAYYDVYEYGTFTFDITYIGEQFAQFSQVSPGPITYIETLNGGMGQLIATGQPYVWAYDTELNDGIKYAYHVRGYDEEGNPILGEKIYADFYYATVPFPSQSIYDLINASAFNFEITDDDREALIYLELIRNYGKQALKLKWAKALIGAEDYVTYDMENVIENEVYSSDEAVLAKQEEYITLINADYASKLAEYSIDEILPLLQSGAGTDEYDSAHVEEATYAITEGMIAFKAYLGEDIITSDEWTGLDMDNVLRGIFSDDADAKTEQEQVLADIDEKLNTLWTDYKIDDVAKGIYHTTDEDKMTDRDEKALGYLEYYRENGEAALKELWNESFYFINPDDETITDADDVTEWRYNYLWNEFFQMDDIIAGNYHGTCQDYTDVIMKYVAIIEENEKDGTLAETFPERLGCVAVTEELADVLHRLYEKYVFEDVQDDWLKFCFYYKLHGYPVE